MICDQGIPATMKVETMQQVQGRPPKSPNHRATPFYKPCKAIALGFVLAIMAIIAVNLYNKRLVLARGAPLVALSPEPMVSPHRL